MNIEVKDVHVENAESPMDTTPFGIVTDTRDEHSLNSSLRMDVMPSLMTHCVISLRSTVELSLSVSIPLLREVDDPVPEMVKTPSVKEYVKPSAPV